MYRPIAALLFPLFAFACGPQGASVGEGDMLADTAAELRVPGEDRTDTVDVGSWNVEWFGSTEDGPTDEARQQANVARVLAQLDLDVVGLVEVVSEAAFRAVLAKLPDHDGLVVTDPRVQGGVGYYGPTEQKVALVFRRRFTVESARVVLTDSQYYFAGRPPMEVKLSFTEGGKPRSLVVLVAHFKAMANDDGYRRRAVAAAALKGFLDAEYPTRWVLVVGDFNDDLDASTYEGRVSPFAPLANDPQYRFTTAALTSAGLSTTAHFASTIDHHLVTRGLAARFIEGSAKVVRADQYVAGYADTTSDHFPVLTRYDLR